MVQINTQEERRQALIEGRVNFPKFSEKYLYIMDELVTQQEIPFKLKPTQYRFWEESLSNYEYKPVRELVLKHRQQDGFTTLGCGFIFAQMLTVPNFEARIVAQGMDYCRSFSKKFMKFNVRIPSVLRPHKPNFNTYDLHFPSLESHCYFLTAGSKIAGGRGDTVRAIWFSEVSFYEDPEKFVNSIRPSCHNVPGTFVVFETTPNEAGDFFHCLYKEAKKGENEYHPNFFPWWANPVNQIVNKIPVGELTDEEATAKKRYNLTDSQVKWRREKIKEFATAESGGKLRMFKREFPENDKDCFLSSQFSFFNIDTIDRHAACIEIEGTKPIEGARDIPRYFRIFFRPKDGQRYSIGVDTAEGLAHGDYSVAVVIDLEDGEQVATVQGKWDVVTFAEYVNELGHWFNDALLVVEDNNTGHTVISKLKEWNYPNMYKSKSKRRDATDRLGFRTVGNRKNDIMNELYRALEDDDILVNDDRIIEELMVFENKDGKLGASGRNHDDLVMGLSLAWEGKKQQPTSIRVYKPDESKRSIYQNTSLRKKLYRY